jgi:hypothetical protein
MTVSAETQTFPGHRLRHEQKNDSERRRKGAGRTRPNDRRRKDTGRRCGQPGSSLGAGPLEPRESASQIADEAGVCARQTAP